MPKLEFDVRAKNYLDAERQATETIVAFVGESGLTERSRIVSPFEAHMLDVSSPASPHHMVPAGFAGHYVIELGY